MDADKAVVMKRMSGRISGLLDDLSDAMALMHDIIPTGLPALTPHLPINILTQVRSFTP